MEIHNPHVKQNNFMHIYRFKIKFEDQDEFSRDIELRADQTFEDFFLTVTENLKLDPASLSSFFICDHKYRKISEISLVEMNPASEDDGGKKVPVMRSCRLNRYIDDPHQKLLLVYDYLNYWTFYIELIRIIPANPAYIYPRISKTEGEIPRELSAKPGEVIPEVEDPIEEPYFEVDGYDPDELDAFGGEEDFPAGAEKNIEDFDEEKS